MGEAGSVTGCLVPADRLLEGSTKARFRSAQAGGAQGVQLLQPGLNMNRVQRIVGAGAGEVPDTPSTEGNRRLELPFSFIVAA